MQVFCDFDGTVSIQDATDVVLDRCADAEWQDFEELWKQGAIGSAECMRRQVGLIRANQWRLDAVLDAIDIDPSFPAFVDFCRSRGIILTVVSDGVDYFIHRILSRHRLPPLPVIANRLMIQGRTRYRLASPFDRRNCESGAGICKCRCVGAAQAPRVYIGDGRSDFCVADKPERVFAKGDLAEFCARNSIPFMPYLNFAEVAQALGSHRIGSAVSFANPGPHLGLNPTEKEHL